MIRTLIFVTLIGCSNKPAPPDKTDQLVDTAKRGMNVLLEKAEAEQAAADAQRARIKRAISEVQAAIDDNELDRAEAKLADIYWEPDPTRSMVSDSTKKLIEQTDQQRETLRGVIVRKRK